MINAPLNTIGRFFVLIVLQIIILNNVQLGGYINPYLYVLFILLLPFDSPKWLTLILAFAIGISIDIFTRTLGVHTSACLFMVYCRPFAMRIFAPREGYDTTAFPTIRDMGLGWFLSYSLFLVLLHHLFFFFVEAFRFTNFFSTLFRALLSTVFTVLLIIIAQYLTERKKQKE